MMFESSASKQKKASEAYMAKINQAKWDAVATSDATKYFENLSWGPQHRCERCNWYTTFRFLMDGWPKPSQRRAGRACYICKECIGLPWITPPMKLFRHWLKRKAKKVLLWLFVGYPCVE